MSQKRAFPRQAGGVGGRGPGSTHDAPSAADLLIDGTTDLPRWLPRGLVSRNRHPDSGAACASAPSEAGARGTTQEAERSSRLLGGAGLPVVEASAVVHFDASQLCISTRRWLCTSVSCDGGTMSVRLKY